MRAETIIQAGEQKVWLRPWADGKVLMMSADERVKSEMIRMRAEENDVIELLTDPDMRVAAEDMDGVMCVIADPERMCLVFDLVTDQIKFAECVPDAEGGDTGRPFAGSGCGPASGPDTGGYQYE